MKASFFTSSSFAASERGMIEYFMEPISSERISPLSTAACRSETMSSVTRREVSAFVLSVLNTSAAVTGSLFSLQES